MQAADARDHVARDSVARDSVGSANRELLGLLLASIACVCVLTVSLVENRGGDSGALDARLLLLLALMIGAAAAAFGVAFIATRQANKVVLSARQEAATLRDGLVMAEAIIKAEPQVVVFWDPGQSLEVVAHTLSGVPGLPVEQRELLRFGAWLEPASAAELKAGLDQLFQSGRPLSLLLKTVEGGHLEADGRAAGSRALLRLRDVAAYKRDLVRILEQHRELTSSLQAGRDLLDALPMPVWLKGADGRIQWANTSYLTAVEARDLDEVRERQLELLGQRQRKAVTAALAAGNRYAKRLNLVLNGERKAHDVIVTTTDRTTSAIAVDVTALERMQGELNRQLSTYDRTLDKVRTAAAVFDREHRLTFFNEGYAKTWGLDGKWLDSKPSGGEILDRLHELSRLPPMVDYRKWKAEVLACTTNGQTYDDWWQLPDGRLLHVIAEQRHDGGVTFLYDDATERLALESRYNALIDVQRETLDSLKEAVAVFATDGRLKLYNQAFMAFWRLPHELLQSSPHISAIIAAARALYDDEAAWTRLSREITAVTDEREAVIGQMLRTDQSVIDFATTPLPDGATLVTFADVTASRRYERALVERNEALVASDRLKNQVIGNVSYELRTPLTNIIGFSELLANRLTGQLSERQQEYLGYISSSSNTLLSIIDDILDLANIDAGMLQLKLAPAEAKSIIEGAILGVRDRAAEARLTFDIATPEEDLPFIADEARVRQVLYNLLSNAVGFSKPEGLVRVAVWREQGRIAFAVEDDGVGIPKEEQTRVFQRFESRSHGSKHRGAGLGLSLVKSLVDLHHGDMRLESEPGRGTRVTVRFPENPVTVPAMEADEDRAALSA